MREKGRDRRRDSRAVQTDILINEIRSVIVNREKREEERQRYIYRETERQRDSHRKAQRQRPTDRERHSQIDSETETEPDREKRRKKRNYGKGGRGGNSGRVTWLHTITRVEN